MGKLNEKVALITGSDSGIGQATAVEFAREGADVVVTWFTDREGAEHTRKEVEKLGRKALAVHVDVRDEKSVEQMFSKAVDSFGTLDILVNNAGVDASGIHVADLDTATWDNAIKTNLYGYFFCARSFIKIRKKAGGRGKIIMITSIHDTYPRAGAADYDCSKGGELNLMRTLALELAPLKINVNSIAPGMVLTPFNQKAIENKQFREQQEQTIPWKRAQQPWEVARLAAYLASDDADYATGSEFILDGGLMQTQGQGA